MTEADPVAVATPALTGPGTAPPALLTYEVQDTDETLAPIAANAVRVEQAFMAVDLYDRFGLSTLVSGDVAVLVFIAMNAGFGRKGPAFVPDCVLMTLILATWAAAWRYADRPAALAVGAANVLIVTFGWVAISGWPVFHGGGLNAVPAVFVVALLVFGGIAGRNTLAAWRRVRYVTITPTVRRRVVALRANFADKKNRTAPGAAVFRLEKIPFLARDKKGRIARFGELVGVDFGRHPTRPRYRFAPAGAVRIDRMAVTSWKTSAELVVEAQRWPITIDREDVATYDRAIAS